MPTSVRKFLEPIRRMHELIRDEVVAQTERSSLEAMSNVAEESDGDTIYAIDRVSESILVDFLEREIAHEEPIVLIAEGIEHGEVALPRGTDPEKARWRIIVDPIDGTRGLMYQKRTAWILTGVAPNMGPKTSLRDVELAVQTEIPTVKHHLSDVLWAIRGEGASAERHNRLTGERTALPLHPSRAGTIAHGFAMIARFFPGARDELAAIDEEIVFKALGPVKPGKAHLFEDQYICTGGQLYELMAGRDRFVADLRPLVEEILARRGLALGICCHPYDVCTELIAREMGVIVTNEYGESLDVPLDVASDVTWIGYANEAIRAQVEPLLQEALTSRGLIRLDR